MAYINYEFPLIDINDTSRKSIHSLPTKVSEVWYSAFLDGKDLVFVCQSRENLTREDERARFQPEEINHLVEGTFYQTAAGLGRTHLSELFDLWKLRFPNVSQTNPQL